MVMSKKEKALMDVVYELLKTDGNGIFTPTELLEKIPLSVDFTEEDLEITMEQLKHEGYFSYEIATKKGDKVYCIALEGSGEGYARSKKKLKMKFWMKIAIVAATALLSVALKFIISAIIGE